MMASYWQHPYVPHDACYGAMIIYYCFLRANTVRKTRVAISVIPHSAFQWKSKSTAQRDSDCLINVATKWFRQWRSKLNWHNTDGTQYLNIVLLQKLLLFRSNSVPYEQHVEMFRKSDNRDNKVSSRPPARDNSVP